MWRMLNKMSKCVRCDSSKNLEEHHIVPKYLGGSDDDANKHWLCDACHDFRHAKIRVLMAIQRQLSNLGTDHFNSAKFTRWIMRLGVLEAFNTPSEIRKSGKYRSYWDVPTTHSSYWYPEIKLANENRFARVERGKPTVTLYKFLENESLG